MPLKHLEATEGGIRRKLKKQRRRSFKPPRKVRMTSDELNDLAVERILNERILNVLKVTDKGSISKKPKAFKRKKKRFKPPKKIGPTSDELEALNLKKRLDRWLIGERLKKQTNPLSTKALKRKKKKFKPPRKVSPSSVELRQLAEKVEKLNIGENEKNAVELRKLAAKLEKLDIAQNERNDRERFADIEDMERKMRALVQKNAIKDKKINSLLQKLNQAHAEIEHCHKFMIAKSRQSRRDCQNVQMKMTLEMRVRIREALQPILDQFKNDFSLNAE